jgi:hypothetical protein
MKTAIAADDDDRRRFDDIIRYNMIGAHRD